MVVDVTLIDPTGLVITTIQDGLDADGGPQAVVRGSRYGGTKETPSESEVPADRPPLVIVRGLSVVRVGLHRQRIRYSVQSFGLDAFQASRLRMRVSTVLHLVGPRLRASGVAMYHSRGEIEGQPGIDPDTNWATETSVYIVHAPAVAVAS